MNEWILFITKRIKQIPIYRASIIVEKREQSGYPQSSLFLYTAFGFNWLTTRKKIIVITQKIIV
jgi:hypothetical protein